MCDSLLEMLVQDSCHTRRVAACELQVQARSVSEGRLPSLALGDHC